ncbi:MAG TPA: hypothetical protein VGR15_10595 [Bacteroidota bacterium]|jgi:hypothetical protein|nr:hypothetical protein [Bacteroidota bacterium]
MKEPLHQNISPVMTKTILVLLILVSSAFCILIIPQLLGAQTQKKADVWSRFKFFEGKWEGTGNGEPGTSKVEREYEFVLTGTFLSVKNKSTYAPQEKNPKGEVHEDWGFFSHDRARKLFVLRQFNMEGFVNQYILDTLHTDSIVIVFVTEAIENIAPGWKGKETYTILNDDEFVETFELAGPGKEFEVYSKNTLKRVRR